MNNLVDWLLNTIAVLVTALILPGVTVSSFLVALAVALVLGFLNSFVKPVLVFLTLPINLLTLGLFTLVINAFIIQFTSVIVPGFMVSSFWWAILFSIILAVVVNLLFSIQIRR